MDRALALITLASVGGVAVLAGVAHWSDPPLVALADLPMHVGTSVRVDGRLLQPHYGTSGSFRGLLSNGNSTVPVTASADLSPSAGDVVELRAQVVDDGGKVRLELPSAADLRILKAWREDHVALAKVLEDPWTYRDAPLRTSGTIMTVDRSRWLQDHVKDVRIRLVGATSVDGDVVVDGVLLYREDTAGFALQVTHVEPLED